LTPVSHSLNPYLIPQPKNERRKGRKGEREESSGSGRGIS